MKNLRSEVVFVENFVNGKSNISFVQSYPLRFDKERNQYYIGEPSDIAKCYVEQYDINKHPKLDEYWDGKIKWYYRDEQVR